MDAYFKTLSIKPLSIFKLSKLVFSKLFVWLIISSNNILFSVLNSFTFSIRLKLSFISSGFFSKGLMGTKSGLGFKNFLANKVEGENFDSFIVLKKTRKGAKPAWVKTGKTDLNYVEVKEGVKNKEIVYVLPSEGLIKYQQRFSERIKSRFG